MPPKKRGTRASKRKAADVTDDNTEESVTAEGSEGEGEGEEEEGEEQMELGEDDGAQEEASEEKKEESVAEESAPQAKEVEKSSDEPPEKKMKTTDDATENGEKEKSEQVENKPEEGAEETKEEAAAAEEPADMRTEEEKAEDEKKAKEENEKKAAREKEEKAAEEHRKELEKYWKAVKDDPSDFTGWTYLLQFVDSKNILDEGRKAYDAFLKRYPYCYGYWKKYSDLEKRNSTPEDVRAVFRRGTQAIPLSVDLWLHFLNYEKTSDKKDSAAHIRQQYNTALDACGKEFRSDKIWDSFVKYEVENNNPAEAYKVYERCLKTPTLGLVENFDKFREFIKNSHPKSLMNASEFLEFRKEILESIKSGKIETHEPGVVQSKTEEEEVAPGVDDSEGSLSDKELTAMREHLVFTMKKTFKETEKIFNARVKFESKIKRPYFHVKPLERSALVTWNEYLDYMKKNVDGTKKEIPVTEEDVEIIYERCLIACALYEEFWLGYINWMESREGDHVEKIRSIYSKACSSHLQNKINIHLRWAMFEEIHKNWAKAAEVLENLEHVHPELTSVKLRRANLERRRGDDEKATHLFEACVEATQEEALNADCAIKFARYLRLHRQDADKAKEVLAKAIEHHSDNIKLRLQMLDLMIHTHPVNAREVVSFLDKALLADFKASQKLLLSQRKLEFLEDFGNDAEQLKKAQEDHLKLTKELKGKLSEEEGAPDSKSNQAHAPPVGAGGPSAYPPVANSANYGAQQQMAYQNNAGRYGTYPQANYGMQYGHGYAGY